MAKLTSLKVQRLSKPGRHGDGGGLFLAVSPSGAKSWVFLWTRNGRRQARGLGALATVSLAEARELAVDARRAVREGKEPLSARASKSGPTFAELAERYIDEHEAGWRNAKHKQQWRSTLATYAKPLAGLPVSEIGTADVLRVLSPIWKTKTITASRVRSRIELVLDYAKALHYRTGENPAAWRGNLKMILPAPTKLARVTHLAAMPYADLPAFMMTLRGIDGVIARALEFAIITRRALAKLSALAGMK
jgi:hypothetical protein